jgi:hypothetical protein
VYTCKVLRYVKLDGSGFIDDLLVNLVLNLVTKGDLIEIGTIDWTPRETLST